LFLATPLPEDAIVRRADGDVSNEDAKWRKIHRYIADLKQEADKKKTGAGVGTLGVSSV